MAALAAVGYDRTLVRFYRLIRPCGPGWRAIRRKVGLPPSPDNLPLALLGWVLGCMFVYSALFGTGHLLYGNTYLAIACAVPFAASLAGLVVLIPRFLRASKTPAEVEDGEL